MILKDFSIKVIPVVLTVINQTGRAFTRPRFMSYFLRIAYRSHMERH